MLQEIQIAKFIQSEVGKVIGMQRKEVVMILVVIWQLMEWKILHSEGEQCGKWEKWIVALRISSILFEHK